MNLKHIMVFRTLKGKVHLF